MKHRYPLAPLLLAGFVALPSCRTALQADELDESALTVGYTVAKNQVFYRKVKLSQQDIARRGGEAKLTICDTVAAFTNGNKKLRAFVYKEDDEKYLYLDFSSKKKDLAKFDDSVKVAIRAIRISNFAQKRPTYKSGEVAQTKQVDSSNECPVRPLTKADLDSTFITNINLKPDPGAKTLRLRPFKYTYNSLVVVPFTIPLKFRFRTQGLPAGVEADFNAGVLFAGRHGWRKFKRTEYRQATRTSTQNRHFTLGLFGSVTPITQTPDDTQGLMADRTLAAFSPGLAAMYGIDRVTFGTAVGRDIPFSNRSRWAYKDQYWLGIIVGVDLFK